MNNIYNRGKLGHYYVSVEDGSYIDVWFGSCLHVGSRATDYGLLSNYFQWLHEKGNRYFFGMGDYMDMNVPTHMPKTMWQQLYDPTHQIQMLCNNLERSKDRIIGLLTGNHELRIQALTSINVVEDILIPKLGLDSDKYFGISKILNLRVGSEEYYIFATHGYGNSRNPLHHVKKIENNLGMWGVDLIAVAQTHDLMVYHAEPRIGIDRDRDMIVYHAPTYIRTGSFLRYEGYPEQKILRPKRLGSMIVRFYAGEHRMEYFVGLDEYHE